MTTYKEMLTRAYNEYKFYQSLRIKCANRLEGRQELASEREKRDLIKLIEQYNGIEDGFEKEIKEIGKEIPIIQDLVKIRGIGFTFAAPFVVYINIEMADNVSSLWRYAGIATRPDGTAQRLTAGQKADFNVLLKSHLYNVGSSFIKYRSAYRDIYDNWKTRYAARVNGGDLTPASKYPKIRLDRMARRKMMKIFLEHLWYQWRLREGLSTTEPWVFALGGHDKDDYLDKAEYGWPEA